MQLTLNRLRDCAGDNFSLGYPGIFLAWNPPLFVKSFICRKWNPSGPATADATGPAREDSAVTSYGPFTYVQIGDAADGLHLRDIAHELDQRKAGCSDPKFYVRPCFGCDKSCVAPKSCTNVENGIDSLHFYFDVNKARYCHAYE